MSNFVDGIGEWSTGRKPSAAQSAPVKTPSTPGAFIALSIEIVLIRACAWGERTIAAYAWPSSCRSSVKRPAPVRKRASSLRASGWPIIPPLRLARRRRSERFSRHGGLDSGIGVHGPQPPARRVVPVPHHVVAPPHGAL